MSISITRPLLYSPNYCFWIITKMTILTTAIGGYRLKGDRTIGIINHLNHLTAITKLAIRRAPRMGLNGKSYFHGSDDTTYGAIRQAE